MVTYRHLLSELSAGNSRRFILILGPFSIALALFFVPLASRYAWADELPRAEDIIEKSIDAAGGRPNFKKIQNKIIILSGTGLGKSGKTAVYQERPDYYHAVLESDEGRIEFGSDGQTVWEFSQRRGAVINKGKERADRLFDYAFDGLGFWRTFYKSVKTVAIDNVDGKPCYKVIFIPFEGTERTIYFEKENFLAVKISVNIQILGPVWKAKLETFLSDYKKVDGLLVPHRSRVVLSGKEILITTLESIKTNVDKKERFDLPSEIKQVLQKRQALSESN